MAERPALADYEAKRDFQKTAEPRGSSGVKPSSKLRFVVQRHDASRLHYDLRLELDGVFKSWAVTKGPSLNPADKRLAVEVEDHPLGYGDFEGTIPKGQYGGGTVQLFDRGFWASENGDPEAALKGGELKFNLSGKRLKGSFVLVRMKNDRFGGKRTNWLLIKHRDAAANAAEDGGGVPAIDTSVASGRTLSTIAAGKGKAPKPFMLATDKAPKPDAVWISNKGLAADERHAAAPKRASTPRTQSASPKQKLKEATREEKMSPAKGAATMSAAPMPDFIEPQLCRTVASPPRGDKWLHEIKFDGYRVQIRVAEGTALVRTRSGLDWTNRFKGIAKAAQYLPNCILDGELVALDRGGKPDFSAMQAAVAAGQTKDLVFFAFDLLFGGGVDLRGNALMDRKSRLEDLLGSPAPGQGAIRYVEHFSTDGEAVFRSARELGLEGIVSKRLDGPYKSGRSDSWTKAKCRPAHDVVLGAWTTTGGKFRSLLGGVFREGKLIYVGRIGTGFGGAILEKLMPQLKANAATKNPFDRKASPPRDRNIQWLEPNLVAEIEFAGWSADGTVRQAAFKRLRDDKSAADVETVLPTALLSAAPTPMIGVAANPPSANPPAAKPAKPAGRAGKVTIMGVALSHPDKALWPDGGDGVPVTKRDLAAYFEAVGSWMMPHIAGRPCSIIRAPEGIDGQTFFQRHAMAGGSKLLEAIMISGDRQPYVALNQLEVLAAVAQSGGLELHPSNCAPDAPLVPGRLVFDLDPAPDVPFADVVKAARAMKDLLESLGLVPFCKTTGGKGLHLVTPLSPDKAVSWDKAKAFARDVCVVMERDAPTKFLTKASKAARTGWIYLDYLRNDKLSTAVAPLSPRGRAYAPVSMPLTWAQVKADLDPMRYTLRTVPKLLAKTKAWADYDDGARPIADAMAKLAKGSAR